MRRYDTIRCGNEKEIRQVLQDLDVAGFHAVVGGDGLTITITEVPETEYLVQAWNQETTQHTYCATLEEAKEAAQQMLDAGYGYAEICEGYPGEWVQLLHLPEVKR